MNIRSMPEPVPQSAPASIKLNQIPTSESPHQAAVPEVTEGSKPGGSDLISSKYAELAKQEKYFRNKIQAREQALAAKEAELKAKEAEYGTSYIKKSQIPEMFQRDSMAAMRDLGLSGDQLTHALLNQPDPTTQAIEDMRRELTALKGLPDQTKKLMEERENQQREQAINVIRHDVKSIIESDPSFEVLKSTGSFEEVVNFMVKKSDEEGLMLSADEAAQAIEKQLTDEIVEYAKLPKIQALLTPPAPVPAVAPAKSAPARVNTLAHSQVSTGSKPMSPRERAIALLEGRSL